MSRIATPTGAPAHSGTRSALDEIPLADLRMALNQDQRVGNSRFYAEIEAMTGQRREIRKRGRPRKKNEKEPLADTEQQELPR